VSEVEFVLGPGECNRDAAFGGIRRRLGGCRGRSFLRQSRLLAARSPTPKTSSCRRGVLSIYEGCMSNNRAVSTVQFENDHLRATQWRFEPGAATGYHRHAHDYGVVPILDGELELVGPDGPCDAIFVGHRGGRCRRSAVYIKLETTTAGEPL
jgi:hypothetical protein